MATSKNDLESSTALPTISAMVQFTVASKVAWLRVDTQTVLTLGPHVITKNHRVVVSRRDAQSWALSVRAARPSDAGRYMCQINTEPMITQTHHLQSEAANKRCHQCGENVQDSRIETLFKEQTVWFNLTQIGPLVYLPMVTIDPIAFRFEVPPDIVDTGSSGEVFAREDEDVSLQCAASGAPEPNITWRREDAAPIPIAGELATKWSGEWLNISRVSRTLNGAFLCIATNGVPPSVSKRIVLHILCPPSVWAVQNLLGGYPGEPVQLQCRIEANPPPTVHWTHVDVNSIERRPHTSPSEPSLAIKFAEEAIYRRRSSCLPPHARRPGRSISFRFAAPCEVRYPLSEVELHGTSKSTVYYSVMTVGLFVLC
ncbi:Lachesin [Eumeta japonica]|uniref:Lachesin n=1 Tax=Eumeta variegata TaxID=151549 RepID=A0A4C1Z5F4_EUMVA|nr:Lachesin [Eumeta japonica]